MRSILIIGLGGFIGAVLRYLAILSTTSFKFKTSLPLGTLMVNILGCLLIGVLAAAAERSTLFSADARNFLIIGILGAFTTFSTFSYESLALLQGGLRLHFFANVALQLILGLLAVWGGMHLVKLLRA